MSNGKFADAEVEAILSGGQPEVNRFVVKTVIELKHGQYRQHELLEGHCAEEDARDERITKLEHWKTDSQANCESRLRKLINEEHTVVHAAHMASEHYAKEHPRRSGDNHDSDHTEERKDTVAAVVGPIEKKVWVMWAIFLFIAVEAAHGVIMWIIERAAGS